MDFATCKFGDYIHDMDKRTLTVCFSARGKLGQFDKISMNALPCKLACPVPNANCVKESKARHWENPNDWIHRWTD